MMCIDFMKMVNGEYHEPQIAYNMKGALNEIKRMFPDDPNPDPNNPKYKDVIKAMPYAPLIAGGLAKTLGIKDEFMTLELWRDLSNGYCPAKYLPKANEAESLMRFAIETPRGLMVKLNKTATPIGPTGDYMPEAAEKDRRIGTEFVFGLGRNTSNVLTALELADPAVENRVTAQVNKIFSEIIMPEMERDAYVRIGADGSQLNNVSQLLAVVYHHTENRGTEEQGPEPYHHWHFDLMNTALGEDGDKLLAVCNDLIVKNKDKFTAIFQRELKPFLEKELGLSFKPVYLDEDRDNEFLQDHERNIASWDVEDKFIPQSLRDELGARAKEMDAEMKRLGVTSFSALEIARKDTREAKTELSPSELKALWAEKYKKHGFTAESFAQHQNFNQAHEPNPELPLPEVMVANYVRKHKDVVFSEDQLKAHVMKQLMNTCDMDAAERHAEYVFSSQCHQVLDNNQREYFKDFLEDTITDPELRKQKQIRFGRDVVFTTTAMLEMDKYISQSLKAREHETQFVLPKKEIVKAVLEYEAALSKPGKAFQFSADQKNAIVLAMTQPGAVMNIAGRAGSGKSTLLKVVKEQYEMKGFIVIGTSIQGSATKALAESTGMKKGSYANTAKLLNQITRGKTRLTDKHVVFVDEAGMADTETLYKLIKASNQAGAKLILTGEKEQLQPVSVGNSYKVLNEQFTTAPVSAINRQKDKWEREMVEDFASGRAHAALDKLYANGRVVIKKTEQGRLTQLVHDYVSDPEHANAKLIVANTNADVERINKAVREEMKLRKLLPAKGEIVKGKDGIDREFAVGDRLIFSKNQKSDNVKQAELLNADTGKILGFNRYLNGTAHTVHIQLDDGTLHHLSLKKQHSLKHAYCVTVNKSQGQTKQSAYYWVSKSLNSLHSAYVACSRHKVMLKMYLSEDMVETLASKMEGKAPTAAMKKVAEVTAKKKGLEIPPDTLKSYMDTRAWLNTHFEPANTKGRKASSVLDDFKSIAEAMSQTQFKKTTWDYRLADLHEQNVYKQLRIDRGYRRASDPIQAALATVQTTSFKPDPSKARTAGMFAWKVARPPEEAKQNLTELQTIASLKTVADLSDGIQAEKTKSFKPDLTKKRKKDHSMSM